MVVGLCLNQDFQDDKIHWIEQIPKILKSGKS